MAPTCAQSLWHTMQIVRQRTVICEAVNLPFSRLAGNEWWSSHCGLHLKVCLFISARKSSIPRKSKFCRTLLSRSEASRFRVVGFSSDGTECLQGGDRNAGRGGSYADKRVFPLSCMNFRQRDANAGIRLSLLHVSENYTHYVWSAPLDWLPQYLHPTIQI